MKQIGRNGNVKILSQIKSTKYKSHYSLLRDNIESDGRALESAKDPPGQRSSYILPGKYFYLLLVLWNLR